MDTLNEIPIEDLPKLEEIYWGHRQWAPHVLCLLKTIPKWTKSPKYRNHFKIYSPNNSWKDDGTIIVAAEFNRRDLFVFTLDDKCENLYKGLTLIDLRRFHLCFAVHEKHVPTVKRALQASGIEQIGEDHVCTTYVISPERALETFNPSDQGDDFYIAKLQPGHSSQIVRIWPNRYQGAEQDIGEQIEINGGYGVFLKENHKLVAWIVGHILGNLGVLQTEEGYLRRGYGTVVTKFMTWRMAQEGIYAVGTVARGNTGSHSMFQRMGFEIIGSCSYIDLEVDRNRS